MKREIGPYEVKTKFPEILRRVEAGEAFVVIKHGKAVARIVPSHVIQQQKVESAIRELLAAKKPVLSSKKLDEYKALGRM